MASASASLHYIVPCNVKLSWKSWNDGSGHAVYHLQSGQTHHLDELSAWVVKLLETVPLTSADLSTRIVTAFGPDVGAADASRYLADLLPRLCDLGLIEESRSCS